MLIAFYVDRTDFTHNRETSTKKLNQNFFCRQKPSESEPDTFEPLPCASEVTTKMREMREEVNALLALWSSAPKIDIQNSACSLVSVSETRCNARLK